MQRPAIVFDFGNVIAFFDFQKATSKLGSRLGISGKELYDQLGPLGFRELLGDYERGLLSAVAFTERVSRMIRLTITHDDFAAAWVDIFTANESIIPLVERLKAQGYRLLLGSNTSDLHAAHFREQFASTLAHFDHLVLSYEVGQTKPNREFYLACAQAAGRNPAECIFIDDLPENVEGARAAGLVGVLYQSTDGLARTLSNLGVVADAE